MRNFFNSHWKVILAILVAIVLATLTVDSTSGAPPLAARLQTHAQALASGTPQDRLRHVEASLRHDGYSLSSERLADAANPRRSIEASVSAPAPGVQPSRIFIVGAQLGPDGIAGAAAVLELAHAIKHLRPAYGTEIRFVFFMSDEQSGTADRTAIAGRRDGGNFMAFVGTRESSQRVRQALAALRSDPMHSRHGLAAPAHVMGLTFSGHGSQGNGPALVITDTGLLRFPYFRMQALPGSAREIVQDSNDYESMGRIVSGLARTLGAPGQVEA